MATSLRELREAKGLTQDDLARLAGIGRNTVWGLELGSRKPRPSTRRKLAKALKVLPEDWGVLYMGGHPCEKVERLSDNLVKVQRFSFAESYAINGHVLESYLHFWLDRIGQPKAMYDFILSGFAEANNGYCVYPVLTHQPVGYSHIVDRNDDKSSLVKKGWATHLI
ncbi:hypothetical protein LCGC14_2817360 [marine sediment metagenome]|uniref:HTH cro/C1-type domain-containing protein n=1 Tax=marine sediment metagenome TaxID=412755 RepID=A0A0F8YI23_9ZZZZ